AWTLVPALLVAFYFNTQNAFYGTVYTSSMHTTTLFTTTICGALTIVAGTYFLIPPMGLMGACVAMALGNFIVLVLRMIFAKRLIVVQVHWVTVLPSVLLMISQAVVMTMQPASYMLWSAVIFVVIVIIQAVDLTPTAKELYARIRRGRPQQA
ncbi:MAG: multidrug transporter, partial [Bifidobacterium castoris]|nr:multidrug transporter [Bifidobacterium castoris]